MCCSICAGVELVCDQESSSNSVHVRNSGQRNAAAGAAVSFERGRVLSDSGEQDRNPRPGVRGKWRF